MNIPSNFRLCVIVVIGAAVLVSGQNARAISRNALANLYAGRLEANAAIPDQHHDTLVKIFTRQIARMEAVNNLKGSDRRKRPGEVRAITEETQALLEPFVDSSKREQLINPVEPLLPSPRVLELNDQLDLSAEQVGRIELILKDAGPELQMPDRPMMQPGERPQDGPPPDMEKMREQMDKMREQQKITDAAIESVLTEDQKRVYQKVKKDRESDFRGRMPEGGGPGGPGGGGGGGIGGLRG